MSQLVERGTLRIPEVSGQPPTSLQDCDRAVADLRDAAKAWFDTAPAELVALLDELIRRTEDGSARWVAAAHAAKRIDPAGPHAGEDWLTGPAVNLRYLRLLRRSLSDLAAGRPPRPPRPMRTVAGRTVVPALPMDLYDRLTLTGFTADVWITPGLPPQEVSRRQAAAYTGRGSAAVSLVLGAGNVGSIAVCDVLDRLFVHRHVSVLKMNPVNDYLGPVIEEMFAPLVQRGALRVVYGGADVGAHLVHSPDVDDVHITGSDKSYEAIVFGPGEDGVRRKRENSPLVTKPVSGELGNVTPVIVVPGEWSDKDLDFQAQSLAAMLVNNAGFNCICTRMLVMHADWPQRAALLDRLREVLRSVPERYPYYPGALERFETFVAAHPEAERLGPQGDGHLPWTLIPSVDPSRTDDIVFTTEAFNAVFAETALPAASTAEFVRAAVEFVNEKVWGTLGVTLVVSPATEKAADVRAAIDDAVADLRFGTVAVNHWSGLNFTVGSTTWGAYPGHTLQDIQSGVGVVHNSLMLDDVEKTVLRGPFRMPMKPPWFPTHRNPVRTGRAYALTQGRPSPGRLLQLVAQAVRG